MNQLSPRNLLAALPPATIGLGAYFHIGTVKKQKCFLEPAGRPFFSLGMNHVDSAPLRTDDTWRREFGDEACAG